MASRTEQWESAAAWHLPQIGRPASQKQARIRTQSHRGPPPRGTSDRDKAVDALMALLSEQSFEQIGLAEVAGRAGIKLSACAREFGSTLAIYAAHVKDIDNNVLDGGDADMAEEPARERLFDVMMRRLEALAPTRKRSRSDDTLGAAQSAAWLWRSMPWRCARKPGCWKLPASAHRVRTRRSAHKARH